MGIYIYILIRALRSLVFSTENSKGLLLCWVLVIFLLMVPEYVMRGGVLKQKIHPGMTRTEKERIWKQNWRATLSEERREVMRERDRLKKFQRLLDEDPAKRERRLACMRNAYYRRKRLSKVYMEVSTEGKNKVGMDVGDDFLYRKHVNVHDPSVPYPLPITELCADYSKRISHDELIGERVLEFADGSFDYLRNNL